MLRCFPLPLSLSRQKLVATSTGIKWGDIQEIMMKATRAWASIKSKRQSAKQEALLRCLKLRGRKMQSPCSVGALPLGRGRLGSRTALRRRAPAPGTGAVARTVGAALPADWRLGRRPGARPRAGPGARTRVRRRTAGPGTRPGAGP